MWGIQCFEQRIWKSEHPAPLSPIYKHSAFQQTTYLVCTQMQMYTDVTKSNNCNKHKILAVRRETQIFSCICVKVDPDAGEKQDTGMRDKSCICKK